MSCVKLALQNMTKELIKGMLVAITNRLFAINMHVSLPMVKAIEGVCRCVRGFFSDQFFLTVEIIFV